MYVALSLLAVFGGLSAWGLAAVGIRGAYRMALPSDQKIIKQVVRVALPAVLGAVLLAVASYALITRVMELSQLGRFLLWEGLAVGLLVPVAAVLGRYARRLKRLGSGGADEGSDAAAAATRTDGR